ncbi:MAG: 50S ribosomal protein L35 [Candidatus Omnitrophica bacterium]|nr:50S ribosomal protein L35 [Candidatus Omnitrophota bacterium]
MKKIKMKTNKAVKKRFRITKNGKVLSTQTLRRHLLTDRSSKKKRQARGWTAVDPTDRKRIQHLLPYDR